jgi:hypothetical protein
MKCEIREGIRPSMDESTVNTLTFSFELKDPKLMNKACFDVAYFEKGSLYNGPWVDRSINGSELILKERLDESGNLIGLSNWVQYSIDQLKPGSAYIIRVRVKGHQSSWSSESEPMTTLKAAEEKLPSAETPPDVTSVGTSYDAGSTSVSATDGTWVKPEAEAINCEWTALEQSESPPGNESSLASSAVLFATAEVISGAPEGLDDSDDSLTDSFADITPANATTDPTPSSPDPILPTDPSTDSPTAPASVPAVSASTRIAELEGALRSQQAQHEMESLMESHLARMRELEGGHAKTVEDQRAAHDATRKLLSDKTRELEENEARLAAKEAALESEARLQEAVLEETKRQLVSASDSDLAGVIEAMEQQKEQEKQATALEFSSTLKRAEQGFAATLKQVGEAHEAAMGALEEQNGAATQSEMLAVQGARIADAAAADRVRELEAALERQTNAANDALRLQMEERARETEQHQKQVRLLKAVVVEKEKQCVNFEALTSNRTMMLQQHLEQAQQEVATLVEQHQRRHAALEAANGALEEQLRAQVEVASLDGGDAHKLLSFQHFSAGDLALFFPTANEDEASGAPPTYVAFHKGCPNHFLSPESVTELARTQNGTTPSFIFGEILMVDKEVATQDHNPHQLQLGVEFSTLMVAAL